jgi:hypothetical protein
MHEISRQSAIRETLDPAKRAKVLALVSLGCSRRMAAAKVPCAHTTIGRAAARDPRFAAALAEAERQPERELRGLLRQTDRRQRKARRERERESPLRSFRGEEVVDMLFRMFLVARPTVRRKDVLSFLVRLRDVLVREDGEVFHSCPNCRRHERLFRALKSLSANSLHQQKSCVPASAIPQGGTHRGRAMHHDQPIPDSS